MVTPILKACFRSSERGFDGRDADGQRVIFFAGFLRHRFDGVEFLAAHDVHLLHEALGLALHQRLDFAFDAVGSASGIIHHLGEFIENTIVRLGHRISTF